jgi:hypothetical protein
MYRRQDIRQGMRVRSSEGEKVGRVFAAGESQFHVEKGLLLPKDYVCHYEDILEIRGDEIILGRGTHDLAPAPPEDKWTSARRM